MCDSKVQCCIASATCAGAALETFGVFEISNRTGNFENTAVGTRHWRERSLQQPPGQGFMLAASMNRAEKVNDREAAPAMHPAPS
jgi:hypothetical protein